MAQSPSTISTPLSVQNDKVNGGTMVETVEDNASQKSHGVWNPTILQGRPMAGLAAICIVFGCTLASLAILLASDQQPTTGWPIQPTVYLAIVTACANAALAFAWLEAGPVQWWHAALQGQSVRSLERRWQVSRSVVQALFRARHLRLLNIACFAAAFVIIDGPLLQRTSSVVRATQSSNITLNMRLPPELPTGFTGQSTGSYLVEAQAMTYLFRDHVRSVPMYLEMDHVCTDVSYARVQGPGVATTDCISTVWPITTEMLHNPNATWSYGQTYTTSYYGNRLGLLPVFYVLLQPSYGHTSGEAASLTVGRASWVESIGGNFTQTICTLLPAIVEYKISIRSNVVEVDSQSGEPRVLRLANNTYAAGLLGSTGKQQREDTMDGITVATGLLVNANASAEWDHGGPTASTQWLWSPEFIDAQSYTYSEIHNPSRARKDWNGTAFSDPTSDIINSFSQLMFRGATMVASGPASFEWPNLGSLLDPGVQFNQTVFAEEQVTRNVFKSELGWYAGAAVAELLTALLILPFYWGFWRFGCNLSMSPFSIALAFNAPIVKDVNSASGAKGVLEKMGEERLKFGVVGNGVDVSNAGVKTEEGDTVANRLSFGNEEDVVTPRKEMSLL